MSLVSKLPINKFCFISTTTAIAESAVVDPLHDAKMYARDCKASCTEAICAPHLKRRSSMCSLSSALEHSFSTIRRSRSCRRVPHPYVESAESFALGGRLALSMVVTKEIAYRN